MLLRIGEPVRATQFAGFVDIDRKPARHALSADLETLDLRSAPRLALPGRGNAPVGLGMRGAPLGPVDQGKQIVEIDAVDDPRFDSLGLGSHDGFPLLG